MRNSRSRDAALAALAVACDRSAGLDGRELLEQLRFVRDVARRMEYAALRTIARLVADGEFERRGVRPEAGVADLLRVAPRAARRLVATAEAMFPTSLSGEPLASRLPATATALGGFEIDRAHAEVIATALASSSASRLDLEVWTAVEVQLADWARLYRPDELAVLARVWIERLDQDGAPPSDEEQVNGLFLAALPGGGGPIRGRLDGPTYEAVARAIRVVARPDESAGPGGLGEREPGGRGLGRRQAQALAAVCEHALDDGYLPTEGGQRPHVTVVLDAGQLAATVGRGALELGGTVEPAQARRLSCDARVLPVVLGGDGVPLDVGRARRTASAAQRAALAVRDGGCAHPGCDRAAGWCAVHHVVHWVDGGGTDLGNLVLLCLRHHIMVHESGWEVRMRDGLPEFVPPEWVDPTRTARSGARRAALLTGVAIGS